MLTGLLGGIDAQCGRLQVLLLQEVPHDTAHNRLAALRTDHAVRERLLANDVCLFAFDGRSEQSFAHSRDLLVAYSDQLQHQMPVALVALQADAGLAEAMQAQVRAIRGVGVGLQHGLGVPDVQQCTLVLLLLKQHGRQADRCCRPLWPGQPPWHAKGHSSDMQDSYSA